MSLSSSTYDTSFFFKVNKKRVLATVRVQDGETSDDSVRAYCAAEGIPPQTSLHLRAAAWALQIECNERGPHLVDAFDSIPDSIEDVEQLSQQLWLEKALAPRVSSPKDEQFSNAYRLSLGEKMLLENMIYMERMYATALLELVVARDSTDNPEFAREYDSEIAQTQEDQRQGYQEFVVAQAQEIATEKSGEEKTLGGSNDKDVSEGEKNLPTGKSSKLQSPSRPRKRGSVQLVSRRLWDERATFLQRFYEPKVLSTGIHRLFLHAKEGKDLDGPAAPSKQARGKGQMKESSSAECSLRICLGQQHKLAYDVVLGKRSTAVKVLCFPIKDERADIRLRKKSALRLYSDNSLRGLAVSLNLDGSMNSEIVYCCSTTTEMHFENIEEQYQHALQRHYGQTKSPANVSGGNSSSGVSVLSAGEVLVSRHSNLSNIHVIFHIVPVDLEIRKEAGGSFSVRPLASVVANRNGAGDYSTSMAVDADLESSTENVEGDGAGTGPARPLALPDETLADLKNAMAKALESIILYANIGGIQWLSIPTDLCFQPFGRVLRETRTALLHIIARLGKSRRDLRGLKFLQLGLDAGTNEADAFQQFFHHDVY